MPAGPTWSSWERQQEAAARLRDAQMDAALARARLELERELAWLLPALVALQWTNMALALVIARLA